MSKVSTYLCDKCKIIYPLSELECVQFFIFRADFEEPKLLDMAEVCPNCRQQLIDLVEQWINKRPIINKKTDKEVRQTHVNDDDEERISRN